MLKCILSKYIFNNINIGLNKNKEYEYMKENNEIRLRRDISEEYKWRLEDIYETEQAWLNDCSKVEKMTEEIKKYKGKLKESGINLFNCLQSRDKILEIRDKLYMYALKRIQEDSKNTKNQLFFNNAEKFKANIGAKVNFIENEILNMPMHMLFNYTNDVQELKIYDFYFKKITYQKAYRLSESEENILSNIEYLKNCPTNIYNKLKNADIHREYNIEDDNGNKIVVKSSQFEKISTGRNRKLRLELFKARNKYFMERKYTLAEIYGTVVKNNSFSAKTRKYKSSIEYELFNQNIPVDVYNNLITTVHENLNMLHDYISIYKRKVGVDNFHIYDFNTSIINQLPIEISYLEATKILKDCLSVFGEEYINVLDKAFNSRWIDVYEKDGKQTLECTGSIYGCHPYVLMNYSDNLRSILTLAHEMGHAMNTYYAFNEQPYVYAYYVPFVGEIASQVNEVLLFEYMIKNAREKSTKIYLMLQYLKRFHDAIILQTKIAEFEKIVHERYENGESIGADSLCEIYHRLNVEYYGPEMIIDEELDMKWSTIPHIFKKSFYVYSYATGLSAAIAIATKMNKGDKKFINAYLDFLKKGGQGYPIDNIKELGIDLSTPEPIQLAFDKFRELLNSLEELLNNED